ncbi:MAG: hypothetical protein Q9181_000212 [Wetmoreana brouardii]
MPPSPYVSTLPSGERLNKYDQPGLVLGTWEQRTPDKLNATFLGHRRDWEESSTRQQFEVYMAVMTKDTYITKVVAFALSSLQLAAPDDKGRAPSEHVRCFMQKPVLTVNHEQILRSYGIEAVDDPKGFELIDNSTLIYMQAAYGRVVHSMALSGICKAFPRATH